MEPVLIAVLGLGLLGLLGVSLLAKRIGRVEEALGKLGRLDDLERRLGDLASEFDRKELNTLLQAKITEMTDANRRLAHAVGELRDDLQELRDQANLRVATPAAPAAEHEPSLGDLVRTHLASDGYTDVRVLSDLTRLQGRSGRVVFEARRSGVMHKGHVNLKDGLVVDESVRAAYSAFP